MGKKSDDRARRKAVAQEKFEASKAAFVARAAPSEKPKQLVPIGGDGAPRVAPHIARAASEVLKVPKAIGDGRRFDSRVDWCISKADQIDTWTWGEPRKWSDDEWENVIHPPMRQFRELTWKEIDQLSSGTGHRMHHDHEVGDLIPEAQRRWRDLDLEQFDSVFRFRLGATKRVWGFIVQAHFYFVWWDRNHSLYPTDVS